MKCPLQMKFGTNSQIELALQNATNSYLIEVQKSGIKLKLN